MLAKGQVATLDDFGALTVHGRRARKLGDGIGASMGHKEQLREFIAAIRGEKNSLLGWEGASLATLTVFAAQESIRTGEADQPRRVPAVAARASSDEVESV